MRALRGPVGGEEVFTAEQRREVERRLSEARSLRLRRRITSSSRRLAVIIPGDFCGAPT